VKGDWYSDQGGFIALVKGSVRLEKNAAKGIRSAVLRGKKHEELQVFFLPAAMVSAFQAIAKHT
jgi:hypothetical protein